MFAVRARIVSTDINGRDTMATVLPSGDHAAPRMSVAAMRAFDQEPRDKDREDCDQDRGCFGRVDQVLWPRDPTPDSGHADADDRQHHEQIDHE